MKNQKVHLLRKYLHSRHFCEFLNLQLAAEDFRRCCMAIIYKVQHFIRANMQKRSELKLGDVLFSQRFMNTWSTFGLAWSCIIYRKGFQCFIIYTIIIYSSEPVCFRFYHLVFCVVPPSGGKRLLLLLLACITNVLSLKKTTANMFVLLQK